MTDHNPDVPLKTFLGGKYAQRPDGEAPMYIRHPSINVTQSPPEDPGVEGFDGEVWYDSANNFEPVIRTVTVDDAGVQTITWTDKEGNPLTYSPSFTPVKAQVETGEDDLYATIVNAANADYGLTMPVKMHYPIIDGVPDYSSTAFYDHTTVPPTDVTATVTAADYMTSKKPIRVEIESGTENLAVTGATEVSLTVPTHATYAEIYLDADDAAIRWTKDGTTPADNNGEQENAGTTIRLHDRDEIDGFRALSADNGSGALDPALTANLTVNYWNVGPDED